MFSIPERDKFKHLQICRSSAPESKFLLPDLITGNGFIVITGNQDELKSTVIDFYQRNCKKSISPTPPPIDLNPYLRNLFNVFPFLPIIDSMMF